MQVLAARMCKKLTYYHVNVAVDAVTLHCDCAWDVVFFSFMNILLGT